MQNRLLTLAAFLVVFVNLGCQAPRATQAQYPKIWVKHEYIDYKIRDIDPAMGSMVGWFYFKQDSGTGALCFLIKGENNNNESWVVYDTQSKRWTALLSFIDPSPYRTNYEEREAHYKDDELRFDKAKDEFDAEEKRIINPLKERAKDFYRGFSTEWKRKEEHWPIYRAPPEAEFFHFSMEGGYLSETRKGGGGWFGGEAQTKRVYKQFVGTMTMSFKSKPVLQDTEEQMGSNMYVSYDFRTAIYEHRSADSIQLDLLDLTELWKEDEKPDAPTPPPAEIGTQPADAR